MERQYKRNHRESYMILEDRQYESGYEETMLRENHIRSLLSFHTMLKDGSVQFWYDITGKQSLQDYFDREGVTLFRLSAVIGSLMAAFEETQRYLIDPARIDLHAESIYMEKGEPQRLYLCYCPFEEAGGVSQMLEYLLSADDGKDEELSCLCYELYEKSLLEGSTLLDLQQMVMEAEEAAEKDTERGYELAGRSAEDISERIEGRSAENIAERISERTAEGLSDWISERAVEPSEAQDIGEEEGEWDLWEEKKNRLRGIFDQIRDAILSWIGGRREEKRRERDLIIEPQPYVYEPTVLLHGEQENGGGRLIYQGAGGEEDFALDGRTLFIGSAKEGNDVCLHSGAVSRRHARIECSGGTYYLEDLNSTNGTSVNGKLLNYRQKYALARGDRIRFADVPYLFE